MDSLIPGWGPCVQAAALARARLLNTRSAKHMLVGKRREDGLGGQGGGPCGALHNETQYPPPQTRAMT